MIPLTIAIAIGVGLSRIVLVVRWWLAISAFERLVEAGEIEAATELRALVDSLQA